MTLVKILTPKETEEIKPGLFIQKTIHGYRQVHPAAWDGKINWKNFFFGGSFFKGLFFFMALMLIAYGYHTSTQACEDFQADPCQYLPKINEYCLDIEESNGAFSLEGFEVNYETTNTLSDYP